MQKLKPPVLTLARIAGAVGGSLIAYAVARYYPAVFLLTIIAGVLYWLGSKVTNRLATPAHASDGPRAKSAYVLSGLGLLGLLSPVLGFIFALPALLIATELITPEYRNRKQLMVISISVVIICFLNAALGAIMHQAGLS